MLKLRARLLGFAFHSERKNILFLTQKRWLQLSLIVIVVLGIFSRAWWLAAVCVAVFILLGVVYRWARRVGYTTFIPGLVPSNLHGEPLSDKKKISVRGTGHFLLGEVERRFLLAHGECWHLPVGDVAFMFEVAPERFAYQFINPRSVEAIRIGELLLANNGDPAIEVTFQTDWISPDDGVELTWRESKDTSEKKTGRRTVLFSFDNVESAMQVWNKLTEKSDV